MEILSNFITLAVEAVNSTSAESELVAATWQLVNETRIVWMATIASGVAVAGVAAYLGLNQRSIQNEINKNRAMAQIRDLIEDPDIASFMQNMRTYKETFDSRGEKAIYSNEEKLHFQPLTAAIIDQAGIVEGRFEDVSRIVNKKLIGFEEFANNHRSKFLEFWALLKDDIEYKRTRNKGAYSNFIHLVERLEQDRNN